MTASDAAPRFFVSEPFSASSTVTVGEDAAGHMRVLRIGPGSPVMLLDGQGTRAAGKVRTLGKRSATVEIEHVEAVPAPADVHALVPIADRDRMLWFAEKAAELALTSWRPVMWKRSRSVTPRGEGSGFQRRVRARMASAIEQSANAWMPVIYPDAPLDRALVALPAGARCVLDAGGEPIASVLRSPCAPPVTLAVGPEGGFDESELSALANAGFVRAALGPMTLRFETAGVVALAHARAVLAAAGGS